MTLTSQRIIKNIIEAERTMEGAGFPVRRPFPTPQLDHLDPFLMLDEVGPVTWPPGQAVGAPDHPHRGFETISYVLSGEKLHEDSTGDRQILGPGDVQWMTAGAGIVHSEMPSPTFHKQGGTSHSFQIWVNLPAKHKLTQQRYQFIPNDLMPTARSDDGLASVKVIAGDALGVSAQIDTFTSVSLQDWTIQPGGAVTASTPMEHQMAIYLFGGALMVGPDGEALQEGQLAILGRGETVDLAIDADLQEPARFLLFGGRPIGEPIARYGPFVMNSRDELMRAFEDYRSGRMGRIQRP